MFRKLVEHFARRLARPSAGEDGEIEMGLGVALALLAAPGLFLALGLLDKYSTLLGWLRMRPAMQDPFPRCFADGHGLVVFSMAITGLVTVWKWEGLLPDATDRLNLAPLPISPRRIFAASLAAVAGVAGVFIADVNAFSLVVFPAVVMADRTFVEFLRLLFAHAVVVAAASIFSFCATLAAMGVVLTVTPTRLLAPVSVLARAGLAALLLAMWITAGAPPSPSRWFRALYGPLVSRPELTDPHLVRLAWTGLVLAALLALGGYAFGYARAIEGQLVRSAPPLRWPAALTRWGATPLERAALPFTLRALWRSETQSLLVCGALVMALVIGLRSGEPRLLPLYAGYALVVAVTAALATSIQPAANWIFRLLAEARGKEAYRVARRAAWVHLAAVVLVAAYFDLRVAIVTASLGGLILEALLMNFRQIPFTVRPPGFRNTRVMHAFLALLGLGVFPFLGGWLAAGSLRTTVTALASALLIRYRNTIAAELFGADSPALVFDLDQPEVTQLRL
ncbi:MAG: hypothetical protein IT162_18735 [Bryobacterales bacterium]|nr:hypothetical protein [Bryobacterales bacterium]